MPFAALFRAVQDNHPAQKTQIFYVTAFVTLPYKFVYHSSQHSFVYRHKEALQIQLRYIAVTGVVLAALLNVVVQHINAVHLPFAFPAVKRAWAKHFFKKRLQP